MMRFCDKLQEARTESGLTQKELAKMARMSVLAITDYESGKRMPKHEDGYLRLASVLGLEEDYLLDNNVRFILKASETLWTTRVHASPADSE